MTVQPIIRDPGDGITVALGESRLTIRLDAAATDGRLALLDYDVAPSFVPPQMAKWHSKESQTIYVLAGRIRFEFGQRIVDAASGTVLHIPENCAFSWRNPSDQPARMLYVFAPGGLERFFIEVQDIYARHPSATPADIGPHVAALWARYGIHSDTHE